MISQRSRQAAGLISTLYNWDQYIQFPVCGAGLIGFQDK